MKKRDQGRNEVKECIKIVEERLADKGKDMREVVYYSDAGRGSRGRDMEEAQKRDQDEEFSIEIKASKDSVQHSASGKVYQIDKTNEKKASAQKSNDPSDFLARQEYYLNQREQNLMSIKKQVQNQEKGSTEGIPIKTTSKPKSKI